MRAILFVLILAVVVLIVAVATGFLDITQTRQAAAPDVSVNRGGVAASGGQAPTFDIETGSVSVGTTRTNVVVPKIRVNPPAQQSNTTADNLTNSAS